MHLLTLNNSCLTVKPLKLFYSKHRLAASHLTFYSLIRSVIRFVIYILSYMKKNLGVTFQHANVHSIVCSLWDAQHHVQAFFYFTFPLLAAR